MILVERATEEDLAHVCAIEEAHSGHTERFDYLISAVKNRQCLIARQGDTYLGFAVVTRSFFGQYFVELLLVHPAYRRQGVASALFDYIEKTCPERKLFTSTNQSNTLMQAFCERRGYVKSGWVDNLDAGDPEIIYVRFLDRP